MEETKRIVARNVQDLEKQKIGRKDCVIYITYTCKKEMNKMPTWKYNEIMKDLRYRNIKLNILKIK